MKVAVDVRAPCLGEGDLQYEFQSRDDARVHHLTWEGDSEAALCGCLHNLCPSDLIKMLCRSPDTRDDIPSLSGPGRSTPTHEQPYSHLILPHSLCTQLQVAVNAPDVTFKCYKLLLAPPPPPGQNHGLSAPPQKKPLSSHLCHCPERVSTPDKCHSIFSAESNQLLPSEGQEEDKDWPEIKEQVENLLCMLILKGTK